MSHKFKLIFVWKFDSTLQAATSSQSIEIPDKRVVNILQFMKIPSPRIMSVLKYYSNISDHNMNKFLYFLKHSNTVSYISSSTLIDSFCKE